MVHWCQLKLTVMNAGLTWEGTRLLYSTVHMMASGTTSVQDSCHNEDVQLSDFVSRRTDAEKVGIHIIHGTV